MILSDHLGSVGTSLIVTQSTSQYTWLVSLYCIIKARCKLRNDNSFIEIVSRAYSWICNLSFDTLEPAGALECKRTADDRSNKKILLCGIVKILGLCPPEADLITAVWTELAFIPILINLNKYMRSFLRHRLPHYYGPIKYYLSSLHPNYVSTINMYLRLRVMKVGISVRGGWWMRGPRWGMIDAFDRIWIMRVAAEHFHESHEYQTMFVLLIFCFTFSDIICK